MHACECDAMLHLAGYASCRINVLGEAHWKDESSERQNVLKRGLLDNLVHPQRPSLAADESFHNPTTCVRGANSVAMHQLLAFLVGDIVEQHGSDEVEVDVPGFLVAWEKLGSADPGCSSLLRSHSSLAVVLQTSYLQRVAVRVSICSIPIFARGTSLDATMQVKRGAQNFDGIRVICVYMYILLTPCNIST